MNDIRERAANLLNAIDLIKQADAMSGGAIGAGIGGLAGGAGKYLLGDKKKSGLRNFTEGALGGAAVGGAVGAGAQEIKKTQMSHRLLKLTRKLVYLMVSLSQTTRRIGRQKKNQMRIKKIILTKCVQQIVHTSKNLRSTGHNYNCFYF